MTAGSFATFAWMASAAVCIPPASRSAAAVAPVILPIARMSFSRSGKPVALNVTTGIPSARSRCFHWSPPAIVRNRSGWSETTFSMLGSTPKSPAPPTSLIDVAAGG